ncbi:hypothetical protein Rmf_40080 [Roseomonas fluvialis]|uniref:Uncharacterized protein n=1 Tax=Roseomonas fluvialis TaxID=1750527 RepID=A0ABN6P5Z2_9PROT|nr:hypothetical protein Rmf_40080 [Roseomonas fluvialis]
MDHTESDGEEPKWRAAYVAPNGERGPTQCPDPPPRVRGGKTSATAAERERVAPPPLVNAAPPNPAQKPWLPAMESVHWVAFRGCPPPIDDAAYGDRLNVAERALVDAAAAGRIGARGEEGSRGKPRPGVLPTAIPAAAFAKHEVGLNGRDVGTLGLRRFAPIDAVLDYGGPYFHHVHFDAAAVLAEWPVATPARPGAEPPTLSELPARWTLLEALAWIIFRDLRTVQGASLETPREATAYRAETRLPGGDAELQPVMGEPGSGRLRLSLEWAYDRAQGTPTNGLPPDAAENDLLSKLRSGAIIARGRLPAYATPRTMDPGDWRGLALAEPTRGDVVAEPRGTTGRAWQEISVARDEVVREWQPIHGDAAPPPTKGIPSTPGAAPSRSDPRPRFTLAAGRAWYRLHVATWPKEEPPPSEATDLTQIRAYFGDRSPPIPRETIREIRRELAPSDWRKSGPRKPR